jgi:hypothetical protein
MRHRADRRAETKEKQKTKAKNVSAPSLLLLLPWLQLDNLVEVQYALPLVHLWRLAAPNGACEIVDSVLVYAGAAYYVGFEAEDTDSGRSRELHLMAVAQLQKQLAALGLRPCLETNPNKLQEPEKLGFHVPRSMVLYLVPG